MTIMTVSSSDDGEGDAVSQGTAVTAFSCKIDLLAVTNMIGLSEQKSFEEEDGNELDAALEENHGTDYIMYDMHDTVQSSHAV